MPYLTWEAVFSHASKRCAGQGVPIACHPHMLRHSFALRMLVTLIHVFDRRLGLSEQERLEYRHLFGDPWVLVQTMLGHADLSTTRSCYLEPVQGLQVDMFLNAGADADSIQGFSPASLKLARVFRMPGNADDEAGIRSRGEHAGGGIHPPSAGRHLRSCRYPRHRRWLYYNSIRLSNC